MVHDDPLATIRSRNNTDVSRASRATGVALQWLYNHRQWVSRARGTTRDLVSSTLESPHWMQMVHEGAKAAEAAKSGTPMPQRLLDGSYVTARYWGIRRTQVHEMFDACKRDSKWDDQDSVATFVQKFVRPATEGTGMGLALYLNQENPQEVTLMVSHAWSENAKDFFDDFLANTYEHEVAYICFLSNYQGTPDEIDQQLGNDINQSPFTQVIRNKACERMLVIPNEVLRKNGQGLYSRLWCDWEIKVAADAGLPIHVPVRNTVDHLLGREGRSSAHARCGNPDLPMNKDEVLIREAIEHMPAETGRSHAMGVCLVALCTSYAPTAMMFLDLPDADAAWGWLVAFLAGVAIGVGVASVLSTCMRPIRRNGYDVLDKVIKTAARGLYSHRRLRARTDMVSMCAFGLGCGVCDIIIHKIFKGGPINVPLRLREGGGFGLLFFGMLDVNKFGPWTGSFIMPATRKWACTAILFVCFLGAIILDYSVLGTDYEDSNGISAGLGWMVGFFIITCWTRKYRYAGGWLFMIVVMCLALKFDVCMWREIMIVLLGMGAVQVRSDWGCFNSLVLFGTEFVALAGLFALSKYGGGTLCVGKVP